MNLGLQQWKQNVKKKMLFISDKARETLERPPSHKKPPQKTKR